MWAVGWDAELSAREATLPDVGYAPFQPGPVLGVTGLRRTDEEAPVLSVSQEVPGEHRVQGIGPHHPGREIVHHQVKKAQAAGSSGAPWSARPT